VEGYVFEEADLEANGDDLPEFCGGGKVFAAGAEVGEAEVAVASEFDAGGEDTGVEVDDGAELDFEAKLEGAGRERSTVEDPATAFGKGVGESREDSVSLFVAEALDVERMHSRASPYLYLWVSMVSTSESGGGSVNGGRGTVVMSGVTEGRRDWLRRFLSGFGGGVGGWSLRGWGDGAGDRDGSDGDATAAGEY
jgi:hypothetical protein